MKLSIPLFALAPAILFSSLPLSAQTQPDKGKLPFETRAGDPFVKQPVSNLAVKTEQPPPMPGSPTGDLIVRMEWFSMAPADARKALRKFPRQADLYQWIGDELDKPEKNLVALERLDIIRARSGQRSKMEAIDEVPFATEFDPPQQPQSIGFGVPASPLPSSSTTNVTPPAPAPAAAPGGAQGEKGEPGPSAAPSSSNHVPGDWFSHSTAPSELPVNFLKTQVTPQSFTIRNAGWTVEMEVVVSDDIKTADINLAPEHVRFAGNLIMDSEKQILQPVFETRKLATQIQTRVGMPTDRKSVV